VVEGDTRQHGDDERVDEYLVVMMKSLPVKQAVALVAELTGENKNYIYKRALELKDLKSNDAELKDAD
jgi:16S rRNA (cytidine1402-2'-O)-methyltransferase